MDLLTRKIIGWMAGVGGILIVIVCLLMFGSVRPGGVVCGLITVGLAAFCYWRPKVQHGWPERGLTWSAAVVGGFLTILLSIPELETWVWIAGCAEIAAGLALVIYHATYQIQPGQMRLTTFLSTWLHTRVNRNDKELVSAENHARFGHLGADFVVAVWPWKSEPWTAGPVGIDTAAEEVTTTNDALLVADAIVSFQWGTNLRQAYNYLRSATEEVEQEVEEGGRTVRKKVPLPVRSDNADGTLTLHLGPWIVSAIRDAIAAEFTYGGDTETDATRNVEKIQDKVREHLAMPDSVFAQLGLLERDETKPNGKRWKNGPCARTFNLEITRLVPKPGTQLAEALGAELAAKRKKEARKIEGDGEAAYRRKVKKADTDGETKAILDQVTELSKELGIPTEKSLDQLTKRRMAEAGATTFITVDTGSLTK